MSISSELKKWFEKNQRDIQESYFQFLRFKSISSDPEFANDVRRCAVWFSDYIGNRTALNSEVIETPGYPLIYAEDLRAGKGAPTLLIYGHYDVQPVDPLELWESDPFEPVMRGNRVYARGAVDNKGQIFYTITALRAWKELNLQLPINLKICIEGEEESSSVGLSKALPSLKDKLKADSLLIVDFDAVDSKTAALTLGARGLVAMEVTLTGSKGDLHSGALGGIAYNPNRAMAELLSKLFDKEGRVQVPGFYDDVLETTEAERSHIAHHFDKEAFDLEPMGGENGRGLMERNWLRPTVEINGISGGYAGQGFKTVIPAKAIAKISCRLVPNQDPKKIYSQVCDFLKKHVSAAMKIQFVNFGAEPAFRGDPNSQLAKAVRAAATEVTGSPCKHVFAGGSIPIIGSMIRNLEVSAIGMGYELTTDNIHAPNEYFDMDRFEKGFLTVARTLELL